MKHFSTTAILLIAALLIGSCASSSSMSISPANRDIPGDFSGIVHAGDSRTKKELDYLNHLGTSWVLHTFYWGRIEPEQGEWDFIVYDDLVNKLKASGIKVLGVLAYDNWWIHDDKEGHRYIPPHRLADFNAYVKKTAEHFRGRVDAWCIWNEPNFIFWNGTDEEFFALAREAADAIREVDSEVILLGGAFNRGVLGLPEKFIRGLFESGAMDKADAVAFHPYELNPARTISLYQQFKEVVNDYGFADKIWITEVGYPTGGWYPTKIREKKLPEYVIKTWVLLAANGSNKLFWYQLFDPIHRSRKNSENFFGLTRSNREYTSKGAQAFRLCAKYLQGSNCYAWEPGKDGLADSVRVFWFERKGGGALVMWNESSFSKQVSLKLPGTEHTRHDIVSGSAIPIQPEINIKADKLPVFITWKEENK